MKFKVKYLDGGFALCETIIESTGWNELMYSQLPRIGIQDYQILSIERVPDVEVFRL